MKIITYGLGAVTTYLLNTGIADCVDSFKITDKQIETSCYASIEVTGKTYPAIPLADVKKEEYDFFIISPSDKDFVNDYEFEEEKVINLSEFVNLYIVRSLELKYKGSNDKEITKYISYIKKNGYSVFNDDFTKKACYNNVICEYDEEKGLYYSYLAGKKMYMNRNYKSSEEVKNYVSGIMIEQDEDSPHCYFSDCFYINKGDVVIDAGVAEGNFALSVIDLVKKIYLIECDESWIEALEYTFEPYKEKVVIVKKFLTDKNDNDNITVDEIASGEKIDAIKMDIEGSEICAIVGAEKTIRNNRNIRIAACSYHKHNDEIIIRSLLGYYGLKTRTSNGYMLFAWENDFEVFKNPEFRRGLVWSVPNFDSLSNLTLDENTYECFSRVLDEYLKCEKLEEMECFFYNYSKKINNCTEMSILKHAFRINTIEKNENIYNTLFSSFKSTDEIIKNYTVLKFLIRRCEFDIDGAEKILDHIKKYNLSYLALLYVVEVSCVNMTETINKIALLFMDSGDTVYSQHLLYSLYHRNPADIDTIYNLSMNIFINGNASLAGKLLNTTSEKSQRVNELKILIDQGDNRSE